MDSKNGFDRLEEYIEGLDLSTLKKDPKSTAFFYQSPLGERLPVSPYYPHRGKPSPAAEPHRSTSIMDIDTLYARVTGVRKIKSFEGLNKLTDFRARDIERIMNTLILRGAINPHNLSGKVVDFGMGTGPGAYVLKQYEGDITGVDSAERSVQQAIEEGILPRDRALVRDGFEYLRGLPSKSLDFIAAFMMHQGFPHQRLYQESKRTLKYGGQLLITGGLLELKHELEMTVGRYGIVEDVITTYDDMTLGNVVFTYTKR